MPRSMPNAVMDLFGRDGAQIEPHTTLQIAIDNGDILRNYNFATASLTIGGVQYEPQLQRGEQVTAGLTRGADQAVVDLQNVDTELGKEFLALGQAIYGAQTKVGRYWRDLDSGATFHKVFLTGVLVGLAPGENVVKIRSVSEAYANISVGASRRVALSCQWIFRQPTTCGYAGSKLTCNFLLNHADGCEGRHGTPLKRAKFGGFAFLDSGSRLVTI